MSSSSVKELNVGLLLKQGVKYTFILEIVSIILMIGSIVAWILNMSGVIGSLSLELQIFLLLLGAGVTFIIFMFFIGIFIRFHDRIQSYVVGAGEIKLDVDRKETRIILSLYGASITFFFIALVYGYFLTWKYYLASIIGGSLSLTVFFMALGLLLISFVLQLVIMSIAKYANHVVRLILETTPESEN